MDYKNRQSRGDGDFACDDPVYSRLFVVCDRRVSEDELKKAFSEFGHIEDVKIPRNEYGQPKGVCFIKYSKTSEAAAAVEAMNKKTLPNTQRPMKVLVAVNRSEVESKDDDEEKYRRLFIHVPRTMKEEELEQIFSEFGRLRAVVIQRDHESGESKGFAYVTYWKFSEAAKAFEQCGRHYRPVFAKPRGQRRPETSFESNIQILARSANSGSSLISMLENPYRRSRMGYTKVNFMCCPQLSPMQVERLFDLIPGMVNCQFYPDYMRNCAKGTVTYSNNHSAAYAVEKLHEFEYPPGMMIFVKPDNSSFSAEETHFNIPRAMSKLKNAITASNQSGSPDLAELANAIAEASKLVKIATCGASDDVIPDISDGSYCSVKLPPPQTLAHIDSTVAKRCFLVCKPTPPPLTVLRDIFCRFGNLINVYTLPNKTVGYARYATADSADQAIKTLHGAEVCGIRIKVLEAEEEAPPRKRKFDEDRY